VVLGGQLKSDAVDGAHVRPPEQADHVGFGAGGGGGDQSGVSGGVKRDADCLEGPPVVVGVWRLQTDSLKRIVVDLRTGSSPDFAALSVALQAVRRLAHD